MSCAKRAIHYVHRHLRSRGHARRGPRPWYTSASAHSSRQCAQTPPRARAQRACAAAHPRHAPGTHRGGGVERAKDVRRGQHVLEKLEEPRAACAGAALPRVKRPPVNKAATGVAAPGHDADHLCGAQAVAAVSGAWVVKAAPARAALHAATQVRASARPRNPAKRAPREHTQRPAPHRHAKPTQPTRAAVHHASRRHARRCVKGGGPPRCPRTVTRSRMPHVASQHMTPVHTLDDRTPPPLSASATWRSSRAWSASDSGDVRVVDMAAPRTLAAVQCAVPPRRCGSRPRHTAAVGA